MKKTIFFTILVAALFAQSACTFRSASSNETSELIERGAFPSTVPSWVNQSGSLNPRSTSSGLIPSSFGVPPAVAASRATGNSVGDVSQQGVREILKRSQSIQAEREKADANKKVSGSALDKIAQSCPQIQNEVLEAIQIEDIDARIVEYKKLSRRCPSSPDLLVWLANDYKDIDKLGDAKLSVERALAVDPGNSEAVELLIELRGRE